MARTIWPRAGAVSGAETVLHLPYSGSPWRGGILVLHGLNASAKQTFQGASFATHPETLADAGFAVMGVDLNSPTYSYPSSAVMTRITDAYTNLVAVAGGTKIGMMGWSGGGGGALVWAKQNPTKVTRAYLFAPLTDQDWMYQLAGYTPAYNTGGITPAAARATEMDTLFSGNYGTNGNGYRIRDEYASWRGLGIPIRCVHADNDATLPVGATTAFVAGVNDADVTQRALATGGHQCQPSIPTSETLGFFIP